MAWKGMHDLGKIALTEHDTENACAPFFKAKMLGKIKAESVHFGALSIHNALIKVQSCHLAFE